MSDAKTLRDELAMSAPIEWLNRIHRESKPVQSIEEDMEWAVRLSYRYADIALRVRSETMPKAPVKLSERPRWAQWACRDEDGEPKYCSHEPALGGCMWYCPQPEAKIAMVFGDTSWIPSNWRESKVRL